MPVGHFAASRRREVQVDDVAALGRIGAVAHQISLPTGLPKDSPCGLAPFALASRSASLYLLRRRRRSGRIVRTPPLVSKSTSVPSVNSTCWAIALGRR